MEETPFLCDIHGSVEKDRFVVIKSPKKGKLKPTKSEETLELFFEADIRIKAKELSEKEIHLPQARCRWTYEIP